MNGGNKKVAHTWANLQMKAAGLFKYLWPFCYKQVLKGKLLLIIFWCFLSQMCGGLIDCKIDQ